MATIPTAVESESEVAAPTAAASVETLYWLSSSLKSALGADDKPYSFRNILILFKTYLFSKRHLFDPSDVLYVNCGGDSLEEVFNVTRFHYRDVKHLIAKQLTIARRSTPTLPRQTHVAEDVETPTAGGSMNMTTTTLTQPMPRSSTYGNKDTSTIDIEIIPDIPESDSGSYPHEEYEIAEDEGDRGFDNYSNVSCSPCSSPVMMIDTPPLVVDRDKDIWADDDESGSETTKLQNVIWNYTCLTCGLKSTPFPQYCARCWKLRKNSLADRPRRRLRKTRPKKKAQRSHADNTIISDNPSTSCLEPRKKRTNSSLEDDTKYESRKVITYTRVERVEGKKEERDEEKEEINDVTMGQILKFLQSELGKECLKSLDSPIAVHSFPYVREALSEAISSSSHMVDNDPSRLSLMCSLCYSKPKNAIIVHGRISHQVTCYECARKLHDSHQACPVCRRKIHMVCKNVCV